MDTDVSLIYMIISAVYMCTYKYNNMYPYLYNSILEPNTAVSFMCRYQNYVRYLATERDNRECGNT